MGSEMCIRDSLALEEPANALRDELLEPPRERRHRSGSDRTSTPRPQRDTSFEMRAVRLGGLLHPVAVAVAFSARAARPRPLQPSRLTCNLRVERRGRVRGDFLSSRKAGGLRDPSSGRAPVMALCARGRAAWLVVRVDEVLKVPIIPPIPPHQYLPHRQSEVAGDIVAWSPRTSASGRAAAST